MKRFSLIFLLCGAALAQVPVYQVNAKTAVALATTPTKCPAGNYPLGVDAQGNAQNCTAAPSGPPYTESQITNLTTDLSAKEAHSALAAVAESGSYTDLSNKPTIPSGPPYTESQITNLTTDLGNKASSSQIPTCTINQFAYYAAAGNTLACDSAFDDDQTANHWLSYTDSSGGMQAYGFNIIGASPSTGYVLRYNGTKHVSAQLQYGDLGGTVPTWNQNTTGTAANVTATSNSTLTTLSALSLPYSQVTSQPTIPSASSTTPNMDGTGAAGSASTFALGDHTHPTDTSRMPLAPYYSKVTSSALTLLTSIAIIDGPYTVDASGTSGGSYTYEVYLAMTRAGVACTAGSFQFRMHYADAFNGVTYSSLDGLAFFAGASVSPAVSLTPSTTALGQSMTFRAVGTFRANAGTAVTFDLYENAASAGCSTIPQFQYSIAVYKRSY